MRGATRPSTSRPTSPGGFTLIELLVVIAIIGILVAFILIAAQDGIRRAQERATTALIAKLESGVADRIEAILLRRADVGFGHHLMAAVFNSNFLSSTDPTVVGLWNPPASSWPAGTSPASPPTGAVLVKPGLYQIFGASAASPNAIASYQRAQVIAQFDMVRAELPDVFIRQSIEDTRNGTTYAQFYPLNFAGLDFPTATSGNLLVPLGAYSINPSGGSAAPGMPGAPGTGTGIGAEPGDPNQAIGIFGASFQAAAGIYKNLGYLPQGYDGADNNANGYVDELAEGTGGDATRSAQINANLAAHTHNTARAEMLYALLVEGIGPLGSTFSRDDFTNQQVQDTDGDGLPEFVDAWNQPIQFFRWPIFYNNLSGTTTTTVTVGSAPVGYVAKGTDPYNGPSEPRQTDPLDPNQTLASLIWWGNPPNGGGSSSPPVISSQAAMFQNYFHSLTDPNASNGTLTSAQITGGALWDRSGATARRAFYSRFLILSAGPDEIPGVGIATVTPSTGTAPALSGVPYLISTENPATVIDPISSGDDITSQGLASPTGGIR